jgi:hypothetical protein
MPKVTKSKGKRVKQSIETTYDFIIHTENEVILSKDGKSNKMNILITRGFNENTFIEMGQLGYLRGRAKTLYEKKKHLCPESKTKIFKDDYIPKNTDIYYDF